MPPRDRSMIVYVEDEPAVQRLVQIWLEEAGYEVHLAADGVDGLELIRSTRPDLVITDALMPNLSGDKLVAELKQDPGLQSIPVIMATAAASPLRVRKMTILGCEAVVAKPLKERTFLDTVAAALGQSS